MAVADYSAQDVEGNAAPTTEQYFLPQYHIQSTYTQAVADWKAKWDDPSFKANAKTFTFSASDYQNQSWSDLGFSEQNVDISGSYCIFFKAKFTYNNKEVTEYITASEAGSELKVTIKVRGYDVFSITPGKW